MDVLDVEVLQDPFVFRREVRADLRFVLVVVAAVAEELGVRAVLHERLGIGLRKKMLLLSKHY